MYLVLNMSMSHSDILEIRCNPLKLPAVPSAIDVEYVRNELLNHYELYELL